MKPTKEMLNSVPFQYANDVLNGKIVTGEFIQLAVKRFFTWIENAEKDGFYLDHDAGIQPIRFFEFFLVYTKHPNKKMVGQPFVLSPFQQFTLYNLFGWKRVDNDLRRITTVYDKRAKKNGKTAEMAGVGLYCMAMDDENESEVYIGATKEDQAKLCFNQMASFIEKSSRLRQIGFRSKQREIIFTPLSSVGRPLGGDSKTQDGINSHVSIIDEYHAHKDDGVKENLESSSVSRSQPITYHITTAGVNMASVCYQYENVCKEVLRGIKDDHHLWVMIHDLDEGDDWENEENWVKANPNMNVSVNLKNIRIEYDKAVNQPSKAPNFKTKHLNMWVDAPQIWIPDEIWMKNKVDKIPRKVFKKLGSYAACDLSTTTDITAYVKLSEPDKKKKRYLKSWFFCPEDTIDKRSKEDRVPYRFWRDAGYLIATPGNTVDYDYVLDKVRETYYPYGVINIELDQWNASQFANDLQSEGFECSFFSQAITVISYPTKQFEKLVYDGKILHDGNPILRWMLSGCIVIQDANENIKVHKGQSNKHGKRVDGIIGAIMALGGSLSEDNQEDQSQYSDPDVEVFI